MNNKRPAGTSTREIAKKRRNTAFCIGAVGILIVVIIGATLQHSKALGIGGIGFLTLLVLLNVAPDILEKQIRKKFKEEKRAIRGARAEEKISELLQTLPSDYYVLHDIESPYGNIDHIVIRSNGEIFLIETKAHGGKVWIQSENLLINGKPPEKDFIAQILGNTFWIREKIGSITGSRPWITPVIVFENAFVMATKPIKNVQIMNKNYLSGFLRKPNKQNAQTKTIWENREKITESLYG